MDEYDAALLQPIARVQSRQGLACSRFLGVDVWTAYELSWLDSAGKPVVAVGEISFPASSPNIVESKSFKYYLNGFNQVRVESFEVMTEVLERDLGAIAGVVVEVTLYTLSEFSRLRSGVVDLGVCVDGLSLAGGLDVPDSGILKLAGSGVSGGMDVWCSHLFRSNCPVTGQPDWASIWFGIRGREVAPESLLNYVVSYRKHQDFHENCVESMFSDLMVELEPEDLWVYARYTRRGGLDINPFRSLRPMAAPNVVGVRQ